MRMTTSLRMRWRSRPAPGATGASSAVSTMLLGRGSPGSASTPRLGSVFALRHVCHQDLNVAGVALKKIIYDNQFLQLSQFMVKCKVVMLTYPVRVELCVQLLNGLLHVFVSAISHHSSSILMDNGNGNFSSGTHVLLQVLPASRERES